MCRNSLRLCSTVLQIWVISLNKKLLRLRSQWWLIKEPRQKNSRNLLTWSSQSHSSQLLPRQSRTFYKSSFKWMYLANRKIGLEQLSHARDMRTTSFTIWVATKLSKSAFGSAMKFYSSIFLTLTGTIEVPSVLQIAITQRAQRLLYHNGKHLWKVFMIWMMMSMRSMLNNLSVLTIRIPRCSSKISMASWDK